MCAGTISSQTGRGFARKMRCLADGRKRGSYAVGRDGSIGRGITSAFGRFHALAIKGGPRSCVPPNLFAKIDSNTGLRVFTHPERPIPPIHSSKFWLVERNAPVE